jgi:hypothetical protein
MWLVAEITIGRGAHQMRRGFLARRGCRAIDVGRAADDQPRGIDHRPVESLQAGISGRLRCECCDLRSCTVAVGFQRLGLCAGGVEHEQKGSEHEYIGHA